MMSSPPDSHLLRVPQFVADRGLAGDLDDQGLGPDVGAVLGLAPQLARGQWTTRRLMSLPQAAGPRVPRRLWH